MSSILLSLAGGIGIYLVFDALTSPPSPARSGHAGWRVRSSEWLRQAGLLGVSAGQFAAVAFAGAAVVGFVVLGFSRSWAVAGAFSLLGGYLPVSAFRTRRRRRQHELRGVWPDAIDNLASGLRAGLSLAEAVGGLAERGPDILRPPFARFAAAYRAGGRFSEALDGLKDELADPVADRVIETLRLAREVGGSELGRLLRTLSAFLREELRVRRE
ncbi:MAG: type II secretion system F family protein, partial [Actinomycetota bacterium]